MWDWSLKVRLYYRLNERRLVLRLITFALPLYGRNYATHSLLKKKNNDVNSFLITSSCGTITYSLLVVLTLAKLSGEPVVNRRARQLQ